MQIVTYPPAFIDGYLAEVKRLMEAGQVAEGRYFRELTTDYVPGRHALPVASGGAAIFSLLAYYQRVHARTLAIIQSNTMRALYTVPTLLGMQPLVVESSYADFLAMNPTALERALQDASTRAAAVVVYSVIGGYLAPSFFQIAETCRRLGVPLVVDGAHAHYLDRLVAQPEIDIAYSFYATKILPAGEGGLVVTPSQATHAWIRRFLMYDRFSNQLEVGINLRASEMTSALIYRLMTDRSIIEHFKLARVEIATQYERICQQHGVQYLIPGAAADYNGYKLVVIDPLDAVRGLGTLLTKHPPTSGVFDTDVTGRPTALPHWCPPTYSCLKSSVADCP